MDCTDAAAEIRVLKLDLEGKIDNHNCAKSRFFVTGFPEFYRPDIIDYFPQGTKPPQVAQGEEEWLEVIKEITVKVDLFLSSYLAPALHLNEYLERLASDVEWDEIKHLQSEDDPRPSNILRRISAEVFATSVLVAVKTALDRLLRILSYYYPGIAPHATWGRLKPKPSNFMALVNTGAASDPFLGSLLKDYSRWIFATVEPRDALIHYDAPRPCWTFHADYMAMVQSHVVNGKEGQQHHYDFHILSSIVNEWYLLADRTLLELAGRIPKRGLRKIK